MVMEYKLLCVCILINARLNKDGERGGGDSICYLYTSIFLASLSVTFCAVNPAIFNPTSLDFIEG